RSSLPVDGDVDEIVRRYRSEIFEHESVAELVAEPAHRVVELEPVLPVQEKGGVHYHAVAHDLVRPCLVNERSNASENRLLIARALLRQGVLDLLTKADALIVRFRRRTSVEGVAHPANRLALPHHFGHRGALVPERLEPHLDPAAHLLKQFGELLVAWCEEPRLDRARGRRNRAEAHRQQVELLHDLFEHACVRHHVPRAVLVFEVGRVADARREPPVIDGVHDVAALADAARREFARLATGDDRVEVLSIALSSNFHRLPSARRAQTLRARISSTPLLYFFCRLLPSMAPGSRTSLAYRRSPCDSIAKRASRCSSLTSFPRAPGSSTVTTFSLPSSNPPKGGSCPSSTTTGRGGGPPLDDATAMPVRR